MTMKKYLRLILLCVYIEFGSTIECFTAKQVKMSVANFSLAWFEDQIDELEIGDMSEHQLCQVALSLDYQEKSLLITFTSIIEKSDLTEDQARLTTIIEVGESGEIYLTNYLEWACDQDACDAEFILNHISWLVEADYSNFMTAIHPLLVGTTNETETVHCFDANSSSKDTSAVCASGLCIADKMNEKKGFIQGCSSHGGIAGRLEIITDVHIFFSFIDRFIRFLCNYDECNKRSTLSQLENLIKTHYNLKTMFDLLEVVDDSLASTTTVSQPPTSMTSATTLVVTSVPETVETTTKTTTTTSITPTITISTIEAKTITTTSGIITVSTDTPSTTSARVSTSSTSGSTATTTTTTATATTTQVTTASTLEVGKTSPTQSTTTVKSDSVSIYVFNIIYALFIVLFGSHFFLKS